MSSFVFFQSWTFQQSVSHSVANIVEYTQYITQNQHLTHNTAFVYNTHNPFGLHTIKGMIHYMDSYHWQIWFSTYARYHANQRICRQQQQLVHDIQCMYQCLMTSFIIMDWTWLNSNLNFSIRQTEGIFTCFWFSHIIGSLEKKKGL